jgi:hypothetical protein
VSLAGLEQLKNLKSIAVADQSALTSLAPLSGLETLESGTFFNNSKLASCEIEELLSRCGATFSDVHDNGPCN